MGYRVRNADGELQFEQFADLEKAYRAKLVDPDDEVRGDGESGWTKAGQICLLRGVRSDAGLPHEAKRWYRVGLFICAAVVGVTIVAQRVAKAYGVGPWAVALPLVVVVLGIGLTQMSSRAFRRKDRGPGAR